MEGSQILPWLPGQPSVPKKEQGVSVGNTSGPVLVPKAGGCSGTARSPPLDGNSSPGNRGGEAELPFLFLPKSRPSAGPGAWLWFGSGELAIPEWCWALYPGAVSLFPAPLPRGSVALLIPTPCKIQGAASRSLLPSELGERGIICAIKGERRARVSEG